MHINTRTKPQGINVRIRGRGDTHIIVHGMNLTWAHGDRLPGRVHSHPTRSCGLEYVHAMRRSCFTKSEPL